MTDNKSTDSKPTGFTAEARFYGPTMTRLAADRYPTLLTATLELIQNAIDGGVIGKANNRVEVVIDFYGGGSKTQRSIIVRDNGTGINRERFADIISHIGLSGKEGDRDSMGEYGLGLMAFVDKAESYVCRTCPRDGKGRGTLVAWEGYTEWNLTSLQGRAGSLMVHGAPVEELNRVQEWWNTEFTARNILLPAHMHLKDLTTGIRTRFNLAMRKRGTEVVVHFTDSRGHTTREIINPTNYTGQKFKRIPDITADSCGKIRMEMYKLEKPTGQVTIQTGQGDYTKPWGEMKQFALEQRMPRDVANALDSGFIEGNIWVENIRWEFGRQGFSTKDDLAWIELEEAITGWVKSEDVQSHLRKCMGEKEKVREQRLLCEMATSAETLLAQNPSLKEAVDTLVGQVSSGHVKLDDSVPTYSGKRRLSREGTIEKEVPADTTKRKRRAEQSGKESRERKSMMHIGVRNDQGNSRYISGTQSGLMFDLSTFAGYQAYEWDFASGTLVLNREHKYYQEVKDDEGLQLAYVREILLWALPMIYCRTLLEASESRSQLQRAEKAYLESMFTRLMDRTSKKK